MVLLESERLVLRPPQPTDAPVMAQLLGNYNVSKNLSQVPHPYTIEDANQWIEHQRSSHACSDANSKEHNKIALCIEWKHGNPDPTMIGVINIDPLLNESKGAVIGYWIGEQWWHQGIGKEAAHMLVNYVFTKLDVEFLEGTYATGNEGSRRILEGLGFREVRAGFFSCKAQGKELDCRIVRLDRQEWQSSKVESIVSR